MPRLDSQASFFAPGPPSPPGSAHPPIMEFLLREGEGTILDLGGGLGAYAQELIAHGRTVVLAEIAQSGLQSAAAMGIPAIDMNAPDAWERIEGKFDTIQMVEVLEHLDDPACFLGKVLAAARRRVLLTVPCSNDFRELLDMSLTYGHIGVEDHRWHFTDAEVLALFPPGWKVRVELADHLGPSIWLSGLRRSCSSLLLWKALNLLVIQPMVRLGIFRKRYPTRMMVSAVRHA